MKQQIIDWIVENELTINEISLIYSCHYKNYCNIFDREYHDDIRNHFYKAVLKDVCDIVCFQLGCSTEDFYETIEGTEREWIWLIKD